MGSKCPPYYKKKTVFEIVEAISKIDEEINERFIVREKYATDLKQAIEEENSKEA